jgi:hypothetical protein
MGIHRKFTLSVRRVESGFKCLRDLRPTKKFHNIGNCQTRTFKLEAHIVDWRVVRQRGLDDVNANGRGPSIVENRLKFRTLKFGMPVIFNSEAGYSPEDCV